VAEIGAGVEALLAFDADFGACADVEKLRAIGLADNVAVPDRATRMKLVELFVQTLVSDREVDHVDEFGTLTIVEKVDARVHRD